MTTYLKGFYADVVAVFACAEQFEALSAGVRRACDVRDDLDQIRLSTTPIKEAIQKLRDVNNEALKMLEGEARSSITD